MSDDSSAAWSTAFGVATAVFLAVAIFMWTVVVAPRSSGLELAVAIVLSVLTGCGLYMVFACLTATWPASRLPLGDTQPKRVQLPAASASAPVVPTSFTSLGDILLPGQRLSADESLCSPDGTVRCALGKDGMLTVSFGTQTLWDSITAQTGDSNYLEFGAEGNLLLCTGEDEVLIDWRATGMGGRRLVMQDDGNLVLYADQGRVVWASDRLKNGLRYRAVRPDLRAHPKRRIIGPDGQVTWLEV